MTDAEIIKALECCTKSNYFDECFKNQCPCISEDGCTVGKETLYPYALDLIKRQKAEISVLRKLLDKAETEMNNQSENMKKLTKDCSSMQSTLAKMSMGVEQAKSEAIKEFAERLKERAKMPIGTLYGKMVHIKDIDNLVKEMVGDAE